MAGRNGKGQKVVAKLPKRPAASLGIARKGIRTSVDFANLMAAMMTDLAAGSLQPNVGNAMCNAGGKLLKIVEMQQKFGTQMPRTEDGKILQLARG